MSTYVDACQAALNGALEALLEQYPKQKELLEEYNKQNNYTWTSDGGKQVAFKLDPSIRCVQEDKYQGRYAVKFQLRTDRRFASPVAGFTLDLYPECCALHQLNGFFSSDQWLDKEFFNVFVLRCIEAYQVCVNQPKRLMINFVRALSAGDPSIIPEPIKNPKIQYPTWYEWASQYPKQETLFTNHNTNRIIHNVIINLQG